MAFRRRSSKHYSVKHLKLKNVVPRVLTGQVNPQQWVAFFLRHSIQALLVILREQILTDR